MELQRNERGIQAFPIWGAVTGSANLFRLDRFSDYDFANVGGSVHYTLFEVKTIDAEVMTKNGIQIQSVEQKVMLADGEVTLPFEIVTAWGEDDQPIFEYVMQQIGVIPEPLV